MIVQATCFVATEKIYKTEVRGTGVPLMAIRFLYNQSCDHIFDTMWSLFPMLPELCPSTLILFVGSWNTISLKVSGHDVLSSSYPLQCALVQFVAKCDITRFKVTIFNQKIE